jgi:hypothetical protein
MIFMPWKDTASAGFSYQWLIPCKISDSFSTTGLLWRWKLWWLWMMKTWGRERERLSSVLWYCSRNFSRVLGKSYKSSVGIPGLKVGIWICPEYERALAWRATTAKWSDIPGPFLVHGSVNTFLQQYTRTQQHKSCVFYVVRAENKVIA